MAHQSESFGSDVNDVYETENLGGAGEDYSRLLALRLLTRATFDDRPFKLAIEFKEADKFDDVAFFDKKAKEWWLIQAKHSVNQANQVIPKAFTWEAMFSKESTTGDFAMVKYFKSFLHIRQHERFQGKKVKLFLFTNRSITNFEEAKKVSVDELDGLLNFSGGEHFQLTPKQEDIEVIINHIYEEICDSFFKLFSPDARAIHKLRFYPNLVSRVLVKEGDYLKFSESFLTNAPRSDICGKLRSVFEGKEMSKLSVKAPANCPDFWSDSSEEYELSQALIDFFDRLIVSVAQPNTTIMEKTIQEDWMRWMKTRIQPDVLRRMTQSQLQEPFNTFKKYVVQWEKPNQTTKYRPFLTEEKSAILMKTVEEDLEAYVAQHGRQKYVGLDAANMYYVSRKIIYNKEEVDDEAFVKRICRDWSNSECFVLFAEPGMGKTTLWQKLAFCAQRQVEDVEVFFIYLNDIKDGLPAVDENSEIKDAAIIMESVTSEHNLGLLLDKQRKIIIFLDAFDELSENNKLPIFNFIRLLKNKRSNVKFLISSRKLCRDQLMKNIQFETIELLLFDDSNRRDFLRQFWQAEDTPEFDEFSKILLHRFKHDMPRGDIEFIGLPLTMKMLAEVYEGTFEEYLRTPSSMESETSVPKVTNSINFLYEQFTRKCVAISLNKKWKIDITESEFNGAFDPQIRSVLKNYQLFAMNQLRLNHLLKENHAAELKEFIESIDNGKQESLLLRTASGETEFAHLSYAEFFCAKYLYDQISGSTVINGKHLRKAFSNKRVVQKFFLKMLDEKLAASPQHPPPEIQRHLEILGSIGTESKAWACESNCANLLVNPKNVDTLFPWLFSKSTSLLHIAARSAACEAMEALLKNPVNIDIENKYGQSPLSVACEEGHLDMVRLLINRGADVNHRLGSFANPLNSAASKGQLEITEYLITSGAEVNPKKANKAVRTTTETPLIAAMLYNQLCVVQLLIEKGADIEQTILEQRTALHEAASRGRTAVVEELLKYGANIDALDYEKNTPLHLAARMGHLDTVRLLIEKGAAIERTNSEQGTALHEAAHLKQTAFVEELLKYGANIDALDYEKNTPLHLAARMGHQDTVRLLIEKGVAIERTNSEQRTALHEAAYRRSTAAVEELLKSGANIDALDNGKNTPLHLAARTGYPDTVRLLLKKGAAIERTNSEQRTALHEAAYRGETAFVEELLKYGANIDALDNEKNTPLHLAARRGQLDTVQLLIEKGAAIERTNSKQRTALHEAAHWEQTAVVKELLKCGARIYVHPILKNLCVIA